MTNLEALRAELDPFVLTDNKLILKLMKEDIEPDMIFEKESGKIISRIACYLLVDCKQISSLSEGDASVTYNSSAVDEKIRLICKESGLSASDFIRIATVKNGSDRW